MRYREVYRTRAVLVEKKIRLTLGNVSLVGEGVTGFTRCWVLGTLCHGHEGWYPPESDIEYLIGF